MFFLRQPFFSLDPHHAKPDFHRAQTISNVAKKTVHKYRYCFRSVETVLSDTIIPISSEVTIAITLWKRGTNHIT